jgi:succinate dehydrogenase / fumarate reductase cytochrome b subunit
MALTGLGLMLFAIGHMSGNLLIFGGHDALNAYAHGLRDHPGLLWVARIGLLTIFLIHLAMAFRTWQENRSARPIKYASPRKYIQASVPSRYMVETGIVLLLFILYHLAHFTFGFTNPSDFKDALPQDPKGQEDVARMVILGFQQPVISFIYIVAQIFLGLHLWHGGSSWLQHLGLNGRGYDLFVNNLGPVVAVVLIVGNCSIPLAILLRWIT